MQRNQKLGNGFYFIRELEFDKLITIYVDHHRLGLFAYKGLECACCGALGTRLVTSRDKGGSLHIDIYTDDWTLMTVDHIIPKALGGSESFDNKQPMCVLCNNLKAAHELTVPQLRELIHEKYVKILCTFLTQCVIINTVKSP